MRDRNRSRVSFLGCGSAAPAAAASNFNLAFTDVDLTDPLWLLEDPDGLVDTMTRVGGYNLLTWNLLAVGSQDYNPGSVGNIRAPRWYKALTIDGNAPTTDDIIILQTRLENDETVDDFAQTNVIGICEAPTSTLLATMLGGGAGYSAPTAANPAYGIWTGTALSSTGGPTTTYSVAQWMYGARFTGSGSYMTLNATGVRVSAAGAAASAALSATAATYIMVCFGTRGIVPIAAGNQSKLKIGMRVSTLVNP